MTSRTRETGRPLAAKRRQHIGLAITHGFAFYRDVMHGIRHWAERQPEWIFSSLVPGERRRTRELVHELDGAIASIQTERTERFFERWNKPVVNIAAVRPHPPVPSVLTDNRVIGELAAQHFLERGLKQFGFIGHRAWYYSVQRERFFSDALEQQGFSVAVYHTRTRQEFDPLGRVWPLDYGVRNWLRDLPKPIGILAPNDLWAVQLSEECRNLDLRVPEDVAILGVDNDDLFCDLARPSLSSIIVPSEQIGMKAAELIAALMRGDSPPADPIFVPPLGIEVRRSTDVLAIEDREVVAAIRFIRENAHRPIRVADVLKHVPVSRRSLERRVLREFGISLGDEIIRTRLERARKLLARTDLTVGEVARECGFSDINYLSVAFRRQFGIPPTHYRAQVRNPPSA